MSTILEEGLEPRPSMINVFIPNQHTDDETRVWDDTQPCDRGSGSIGGSVAERDTRWVQAKRVKPNNPRESEARPAPEENMLYEMLIFLKRECKPFLVVSGGDGIHTTHHTI